MVVRHDKSNSRIVALSINPMRCNPAAVSWIASASLLRYFFALAVFFAIAMQLLQFSLIQRRLELCTAQVQIFARQFLQIRKLPVVDVIAFILGKPVQEHASLGGTKSDQRTESAGPPTSRPRYSLLDQAASQIGVD